MCAEGMKIYVAFPATQSGCMIIVVVRSLIEFRNNSTLVTVKASTVNGQVVGKVVMDIDLIQTRRIGRVERAVMHICERVNPTSKSNWIFTSESPHLRIVEARAVIDLLRIWIAFAAREAVTCTVTACTIAKRIVTDLFQHAARRIGERGG